MDDDLWRNIATLQYRGVARGYAPESCRALGVAPPCFGPLDNVTYGQTISFISRACVAKGLWQQQVADDALYGGILIGTGHADDVATFLAYTRALGGVPGFPETGPFTVWNQPTTREWFARALWNALSSYYAVDRVP